MSANKMVSVDPHIAQETDAGETGEFIGPAERASVNVIR
jgi:hypothetical protein